MKNEPIRLALADDHAILRKGLTELINNFEGLNVVIDANNGRELIDKIAAQSELPDVCIIDINMPVMDGYETAKALKEKWPQMKVLGLSMYDTEFNIIKILRCGADGYVLKDAHPGELQMAIKTVYKEGFFHAEPIAEAVSNGVSLNEAEKQFLALCCNELTYKEIADKMQQDTSIIECYRDNLSHKLNIKSRTGMVMYALQSGITPIN